MPEHSLTRDQTHDRWNRALPPALTIRSGDTVHFQCHDATGGQLSRATTTAEFHARNHSRVHTLTGPVFIEGARPGDVLEIHILAVRHGGWGWSGVTPGLGLLPERFNQPFFFVWELEEHFTRSLAPAVVPLAPFCGILGVARAEHGEFRTRAPGPFGGNLDVRQLTAGATLYLPIFVEGALFSCGDAHAAQGDGEVCLNGIETPADVTLRFTVRRDFLRLAGPLAESPPRVHRLPDRGQWLTIECDPDPIAAARRALDRMIDCLGVKPGLSPEHAYLLCSAALSLRLSQVVNAPVHTVSALLPKNILPE